MINLYNQVPSIYTNASRDFQYLSWLFNIVLNSVKHNIDDIYKLPSAAIDPKLTELLAMTLGFKIKRNYDQKQLIAIVAILHSALRYKGTEKAIRMAAEALVKAMGSLGEADVQINGTEIRVTLPKDLTDITLFLDILDYILPAGMTCRVVRKSQNTKKIADIRVKYSDEVKLLVENDLAWNERDGINQSAGISSLYPFDEALTTANILFEKDAEGNEIPNSRRLNAGLLDNTIIPVLADSRPIEVDDTLTTNILYSTEADGRNLLLKAGIDEHNTVVLKAKKAIQEL